METYEIRYFLAVARFQNVHRASEHANVSTASLSKAVARLETELAVKLFSRVGRNIRLTDAGKLFQKKGSEIVRLVDASKIEVGGHANSLHVDLGAEEILQAKYGVELAKKLSGFYPNSTVHFMLADEKKVIQQVESGDIHIGIISSDAPKGLYSKLIDKVEFKTCVGRGHPLFKTPATKEIPVEKILEYDFVAPSLTMLGSVPQNAALDGWRDDKFKRKLTYQACGLKVLEEIVNSGLAMAYLPDYFISAIGAKVVNASGCPYKCQQKIRVIAKKPEDVKWLQKLLSSL